MECGMGMLWISFYFFPMAGVNEVFLSSVSQKGGFDRAFQSLEVSFFRELGTSDLKGAARLFPTIGCRGSVSWLRRASP